MCRWTGNISTWEATKRSKNVLKFNNRLHQQTSRGKRLKKILDIAFFQKQTSTINIHNLCPIFNFLLLTTLNVLLTTLDLIGKPAEAS